MIKLDRAALKRSLIAVKKQTKEVRAVTTSRETMEGVAELGARIVQNRTQRGRDIRGGSFKKYSQGYKAWREKKGRKGSPVDLTFSGRMLNAMVGKFVTRGKAEIVFTRGEEANKAAENTQRGRDFFGIVTGGEIQKLTQEAGRLIDKRMKKRKIT